VAAVAGGGPSSTTAATPAAAAPAAAGIVSPSSSSSTTDTVGGALLLLLLVAPASDDALGTTPRGERRRLSTTTTFERAQCIIGVAAAPHRMRDAVVMGAIIVETFMLLVMKQCTGFVWSFVLRSPGWGKKGAKCQRSQARNAQLTFICCLQMRLLSYLMRHQS
jgi:hypothetical protein